MQNTKLAELVETQKQESFIDPAAASDEEALGILIAHHLGWDADKILEVAAAAMEDANFQDESGILTAMREKL